MDAGRVGSGLNRSDRDAIKEALDNGYEVPVEVKFYGLSKRGMLRHPVFLCFRTDLNPQDQEALGVSQFIGKPVVT